MNSAIFLSYLSFILPYSNVLASTHSDGYIGCYLPTSHMEIVHIKDNNGSVCKKHCFPQFIYAGTKLDNCYCGLVLSEDRVNEANCSFQCPGQPYHGPCGGLVSITMYDIHETDLKTEDGRPWSIHNQKYFENLVTDKYHKENWKTSTSSYVAVQKDSSLCIVVTSSIAFGLLILLILVLITYRCTSKTRRRKGLRRRAPVGQYLTAMYSSRATDHSLNSNVQHVMNSSVFEHSYI